MLGLGLVIGLVAAAQAIAQSGLEVGAGAGYQAAILSQLARRVYTVDRHRRLVHEARDVFTRLDLTNITAITGDGSFGLPDQAPFDRIIVTAAAEDPPGPLLAQLKTGGIMVLPVGQSDTVQSLIKVTRHETGYDYEELRAVRETVFVQEQQAAQCADGGFQAHQHAERTGRQFRQRDHFQAVRQCCRQNGHANRHG